MVLLDVYRYTVLPQALVSLKNYMLPPLPSFKVNICPFPLPHFTSICFAYLCSFRWPNYIVTLLRCFSFRLPHLNIPTGPPSDEYENVTSHEINMFELIYHLSLSDPTRQTSIVPCLYLYCTYKKCKSYQKICKSLTIISCWCSIQFLTCCLVKDAQ